MPAGSKASQGTLYLVGTPIGNLADITLRAIDVLKQVPQVAAEDTRRTRALLSHLGIAGKRLHTVSANTRPDQLDRLLDHVEQGADLALVTDAGMPSVSDPGAHLVERARQRQIRVVCIPGPSAVTAAVALSGLVQGPFLFLGFLPRHGKKRQAALERIEHSPEPVVLFESPLRTSSTLADLAVRMPERRAALCRELTKVHEEVQRGTLAELSQQLEPLRGEVTLVVDKGPSQTRPKALSDTELEQAIRELLAAGSSPKGVVLELFDKAAVSRQALYARVQAIYDQQDAKRQTD